MSQYGARASRRGALRTRRFSVTTTREPPSGRRPPRPSASFSGHTSRAPDSGAPARRRCWPEACPRPTSRSGRRRRRPPGNQGGEVQRSAERDRRADRRADRQGRLSRRARGAAVLGAGEAQRDQRGRDRGLPEASSRRSCRRRGRSRRSRPRPSQRARSRSRHQSRNGFDQYDDTRSQLAGVSAEATRTNQAVDATRSQVVLYNGKVAQTFFFHLRRAHREQRALLTRLRRHPDPLPAWRP